METFLLDKSMKTWKSGVGSVKDGIILKVRDFGYNCLSKMVDLCFKFEILNCTYPLIACVYLMWGFLGGQIFSTTHIP